MLWCQRGGSGNVERKTQVQICQNEVQEHRHFRKTFLAEAWKARCHNADMHGAGKSVSLVVPKKWAINAGKPMAAEFLNEGEETGQVQQTNGHLPVSSLSQFNALSSAFWF